MLPMKPLIIEFIKNFAAVALLTALVGGICFLAVDAADREAEAEVHSVSR